MTDTDVRSRRADTTVEPFAEPIYVTRPFLPPLDQYASGLKEIWDNVWLTNNGPVLKRFTSALERRLDTQNLCLFANGTLALQIALHGLGLTGEVITTPFTFVATAHALWWNNLKPVFVDIEPDRYTIDPGAVEAAITPNTSAILAVHVFGHPCNLQSLADVARRHGLKLIYDAAHAFGVTVDGESIARFGDVSMFSFHATKLYHTIEGGMLTFSDPGHKQMFNHLKNFGIASEVDVVGLGTNAKMNEFQALMGLQVLPHLDDIIAARAEIAQVYRERLSCVPSIRIPPALPGGIGRNYAYQPVEVLDGQSRVSRDELYEGLKRFNIFTRRYFYPLLSDLPCYQGAEVAEMPVAARTARQILTLPIYSELPTKSVHRICSAIEYLMLERSG